MPQITAVMDVYNTAKEYGIPVIADGGIKFSGDLTKAIAAGADVCMMGSMFAGCDEAPGDFELFRGRKYKVYRGMGSIAAMENGSKDRYFQTGAKKLVPEGVEGRVAYKGLVEDTIFQLMGGYVQVWDIVEHLQSRYLQETAQFIKMSSAALKRVIHMIFISLSGFGVVNAPTAVFICLGADIGSCFTALISSAGVSKNAKRAAVINLCSIHSVLSYGEH